jgi:hypothetical protein
MGEDVVQFAVGKTVLLVGCPEQRGLEKNLSKARRLLGRYYSGRAYHSE